MIADSFSPPCWSYLAISASAIGVEQCWTASADCATTPIDTVVETLHQDCDVESEYCKSIGGCACDCAKCQAILNQLFPFWFLWRFFVSMRFFLIIVGVPEGSLIPDQEGRQPAINRAECTRLTHSGVVELFSDGVCTEEVLVFLAQQTQSQ